MNEGTQTSRFRYWKNWKLIKGTEIVCVFWKVEQIVLEPKKDTLFNELDCSFVSVYN